MKNGFCLFTEMKAISMQFWNAIYRNAVCQMESKSSIVVIVCIAKKMVFPLVKKPHSWIKFALKEAFEYLKTVSMIAMGNVCFGFVINLRQNAEHKKCTIDKKSWLSVVQTLWKMMRNERGECNSTLFPD